MNVQPLSGRVLAQNLEDEFQAQLDSSGTARAENGVEGSVVWRGAAAAENTRL